VRQPDELEALRGEIRDRYGAPPPEVEGLLRYAALRQQAEALGVTQVDRGARVFRVRFDEATPVAPEALVALAGERPGATLSPDGLAWPLTEETTLEGLDALFDRLRPGL
jgi:transcription-repair coupling factor (superfamily II helicase)